MVRNLGLILAGLLACPAGAAQSAGPESSVVERNYSLEDAINLGLKNDSRLLSAEQDRIISEERVVEARLQFLPEFGLHGSATKFNARYPFSLSQDFRNILLYPGTPENIYSARGYMYFPIYEGGRSINTVRLAQAAFNQSRSNYESVRRDVILAVKEAFQRLLFVQERKALAQEGLQAAGAAAENPRLDAWERIESNVLLGHARVRIAEVERDLRLARLAFLRSLNQEIDTSFRVEGRMDPRPVEVDVQKVALWAMELRPELQSETYRAEMDAIGVNLAWGRRNPTLFVASDYEVTAQHFPLRNNNWDLGIGIRIPLTYDFFTKLRQKRAEQRQGQLKRAALQDQVRLEVRQACEHLQYWQAEMSTREAQYRAVAKLFESLPAGAGPVLARLKALNSVLDLRLSYLTSVTEHILARARLERAVGRELAQ
ncbi:MAG: TolC family protein [Elusimicrobiota bacterium]|jgi:outer membrane protein TolC